MSGIVRDVVHCAELDQLRGQAAGCCYMGSEYPMEGEKTILGVKFFLQATLNVGMGSGE